MASSRPLEGLEVAIVGGSVSGLAAALFLSDAGADTHVYERTPEKLQRRGSGLFLRPEAHGALGKKGVSLSSLSSPVDTWRRTVGGVTTDRIWSSAATTWDHLQGTLRAEVTDDRYHNGHRLIGLDVSGEKPKARFANGEEVEPDLVVVADGAGSTGRALLERTSPTYAGYIAWRGMVPASRIEPRTRAKLHGKVTEFVGDENRIVAFEVPSIRPGETSEFAANHVDWNWCINAPEDELAGLLGERFARSGLLPPGAIDPMVADWLHSLADDLLPPDLAQVVIETETPFARTIIDHPPTRMAWPGVALVGDAAATVRPHTGAASSKAINDVEALAECLGQTREYGTSRQALQYGLDVWEQQRLPVAKRFSHVGKRIGGELNLGRTAWGPAHPFDTYRNSSPTSAKRNRR